jgi:hypothetical protein
MSDRHGLCLRKPPSQPFPRCAGGRGSSGAAQAIARSHQTPRHPSPSIGRGAGGEGVPPPASARTQADPSQRHRAKRSPRPEDAIWGSPHSPRCRCNVTDEMKPLTVAGGAGRAFPGSRRTRRAAANPLRSRTRRSRSYRRCRCWAGYLPRHHPPASPGRPVSRAGPS